GLTRRSTLSGVDFACITAADNYVYVNCGDVISAVLSVSGKLTIHHLAEASNCPRYVLVCSFLHLISTVRIPLGSFHYVDVDTQRRNYAACDN
ncbi:hypothetical protein TSAR_009301, partial [Trichomalopsis sarcophagae]